MDLLQFDHNVFLHLIVRGIATKHLRMYLTNDEIRTANLKLDYKCTRYPNATVIWASDVIITYTKDMVIVYFV